MTMTKSSFRNFFTHRKCVLNIKTLAPILLVPKQSLFFGANKDRHIVNRGLIFYSVYSLFCGGKIETIIIMTGFKILSPYNPGIVLFDGRHLSKEDCDRVSGFLRDGMKANADKDILLLDARKMYSDLIHKHENLRAGYMAELCMLKYKYKEQKKINAELIGTIEDLDAGKADLAQTLEETELALAGSKRKYAELEKDMVQDRLEKEDIILDHKDTIDYIQSRKEDLAEHIEQLEKQNKYLQERIVEFVDDDKERAKAKAKANVTNHCIIS